MRFEPREIALRDGRACVLRSPEVSDAAELLELRRVTSGETDYMARYPDELTGGPAEQAEYLEKLIASPRGCNICAFVDGEMAASGSVAPLREGLYKYGHRAGFGICVLKKYWNLGIGRAVTAACIETARQAGFEILELEVIAENRRAAGLYEKMGFTPVGIRPRAFRLRDGKYADEIMMTMEL